MIHQSYDDQTPPLFGPENVYGCEQQHLCDVCVVTFSKHIFDQTLKSFHCEQVARIGTANGGSPIYLLTAEGKKVAFYLSAIGSALAATFVIDANWLTGATKFILFGSAGSLNDALTEGRFVLPTEAYRDEGISYHYAPPSDYIKVPQSDKLARIFDSLCLPYVQGRVWTTDALYRETVANARKRRLEGCIAVEMEVAGVQAVCSHHGWELYPFLVTGDVLEETTHRMHKLYYANHDMRKLIVALEAAKRV